MNKSVYSLVLMDNVVSEVDKMAYEMGTSRSNLINQILAEYVRYTTPEMRMRAVFEEMERLMQGVDSFQIQPQPSDAMLTIRSALRYKYKPTIRYSVELYRSSRGRTVGALKVAFRTQSQPLIEMLTSFSRFGRAWRGTTASSSGCPRARAASRRESTSAPLPRREAPSSPTSSSPTR